MPHLARFVALALVLTALAEGPTASAVEPVPTSLTLTAERGYADGPVPLRLLLQADDGTPVPGAQVVVERRRDGVWRRLGVATTDEEGRAVLRATRFRSASNNVFRARYAGDETLAPARAAPVTSRIVKRASRVTVRGTHRLVDETSGVLEVRWRTGSGIPVRGELRLLRSLSGRPFRQVDVVRTGGQGLVRVPVAPRYDSRWRAAAAGNDWVRGARSTAHRIDNLPPSAPVAYPAAAPEPRVRLPRQARATGRGASPRVSTIPDRVWRTMVGRSWHQGCPVGRSGLRLLRVNYWGYDGYRYRGELVAAAGAVDNMAGALAEMYAGRFPIRAMYRVDRFGWSSRVQGADDYASMAAGNTSAFNCRWVVGNPGTRSPHSFGGSLDVNTWENPYRSAQGLVPNSWWQPHSDPRIAWRSREHAVVRIMARQGLRWTYGTGDSQHFDVGGSTSRRTAVSARCSRVCH